jgi:glycosyltransferase involved in cell wall biosynthesis
VIPNIVPPEVFRQIPMANTRAAFGLPLGKKIIGFGAAYDIIDSKSIKGGDLLLDALRKLPKDGDYFLLAFGPVGQKFQNEVGFPSFYSGYVQNPGILAALYNSCDVFVLPSVIENLSTTAMEAQFCGVPVVAFATGGNSDIVEHRSTGYLAPLFDIKELAHGIEYCIKNHDRLSKRAAARMKSEFSADSIVLAHITLYKSMFENQRNQKVLCHVDKP